MTYSHLLKSFFAVLLSDYGKSRYIHFFKVIFYYAVDSTEIIVPFNSGFPDPIVVLNVATVSKSNVTQ